MSIPYTHSYEGSSGTAGRVEGVLSLNGEELLFEFKVFDGEGGAVSNLNKFGIDVNRLRRVQLMKGLFSNKLIIEAAKPPFLGPLPGTEDGKIKLKITRNYKKEASQLAERLNRFLSDH